MGSVDILFCSLAEKLKEAGRDTCAAVTLSFDLASRGQVIVTIGIKPNEPATGYGYIQVGNALPPPQGVKAYKTAFFKAERFVEKPNYETAQQYLASGQYRWNAGMFIWSFVTITQGLEKHQPEMAAACQRWFKAAVGALVCFLSRLSAAIRVFAMSAEAVLSPSTSPASAAAASGKTQRLMSVDALRGFDMFWIIGADALVYALDRMSRGPDDKPHGIFGFLAFELDHADWAGFHFYDLIFPLFVFIVGVSLVFSLGKTIQREGKTGAVKRILRRSALMFLVALFYSGGFGNAWPEIRLMGVLNRIAICYGCAGIIFCFCNLRMMIAICVGLLVGYWALMTFVPIRDIQLEQTSLEQLAKERGVPFDAKQLFYSTTNYVTGHFEHGFDLSDHIDFQYLPGRKYDTYFDPEGFLSTLPAIGTCLLGVFAGLLLANASLRETQKLIYLLMGGLILVALGWAWSTQFPVVKKIWTSSFVLVAGGYSALLLGLFYWVIDIAQYRKWCQPFVWMGMNSITIYLIKNFLGGSFSGLSKRFVGGDIRAFLESHARGSGDLAMAVVGLAIAFGIVRFLYKRQIFLRL